MIDVVSDPVTEAVPEIPAPTEPVSMEESFTASINRLLTLTPPALVLLTRALVLLITVFTVMAPPTAAAPESETLPANDLISDESFAVTLALEISSRSVSSTRASVVFLMTAVVAEPVTDAVPEPPPAADALSMVESFSAATVSFMAFTVLPLIRALVVLAIALPSAAPPTVAVPDPAIVRPITLMSDTSVAFTATSSSTSSEVSTTSASVVLVIIEVVTDPSTAALPEPPTAAESALMIDLFRARTLSSLSRSISLLATVALTVLVISFTETAPPTAAELDPAAPPTAVEVDTAAAPVRLSICDSSVACISTLPVSPAASSESPT